MGKLREHKEWKVEYMKYELELRKEREAGRKAGRKEAMLEAFLDGQLSYEYLMEKYSIDRATLDEWIKDYKESHS